MGCGSNSDSRSNNGCVCDVVRAIKEIQDNAVQDDDCLDCPSCFLEPLGTLVSPARDRADTRVFVLKNADGSPFHAFFSPTNGACVSIFFRVEDVYDNCCATLRVLIPGRRDDKNQDTGKMEDLRRLISLEEKIIAVLTLEEYARLTHFVLPMTVLRLI